MKNFSKLILFFLISKIKILSIIPINETDLKKFINKNTDEIEKKNSSNYSDLNIGYYRSLINDLEELKIKEKISDIVNNIQKYDENSDLSNNLRNLQNILIEIENLKDSMQKLIIFYEYLIDEFFKEKLIFEKEENINSFSQYIDNLKKFTLYIYHLNNELNNLENKIKIVLEKKKEKEDILVNENFSEKKLNKGNFKEKIIKEIDFYKKKLNIIKIKNKELELKILEIRRSIIKEKIKSIKINFNKLKIYNKLSENKIKAEIEKEKNLKNIYFEERDKLINELKNINTKISEIILKNNPNLINKDIQIEKIINEILTNLINNNNNNDYNLKNEDLNLLINILNKKELIDLEIDKINLKIFLSEKYISFYEGWNLILKYNSSIKDINSFLNKIELSKIKENIEIAKEKYTKYFEISKYFKILLNKDLNNENINKNLLDDSISEYISLINNLDNVYSITIVLEEELKLKTFWTRSKYSISMDQLENFYSDIKIFIKNTINGFKPFILSSYYFLTLQSGSPNISVLNIIISIIIATIIGFFYFYNISFLNLYFIRLSQNSTLAARINLFINFLINKGLSLYIWFSIFILFKLNIIPSKYGESLFYLISIIYFLIFSKIFFNWLEEINKQKNYILISIDYLKRFIIVTKLFVNLSIILLFFREAFIMNCGNTSIPKIILAIEFILIQITLISLIKKDQILSIIPEENKFTYWIKDILNKYYFFFLCLIISIITMSNPYVGYGKQVLYILSRSIITFIIIPFFLKIFNTIRDKSFDIFFRLYEGETQNKIPGAKLIYLFINFTILIFIYLLITIILAKIWEFNLEIKDIKGLLEINLIPSNINFIQEKINFFSIIDITRVILFTISGFIISYLFNILFLFRILNPIIISQSVQNTITTILKYIIVIFMLILGLFLSGLQNLTTKLAVSIGFLGFAIKEPIADFFSYFIILIQRPIKVGDLVKLNGGNNDEIKGIIRQITPRTTLIRERNSHTIIVPNSVIISKLITNWNFLKNSFVAIEDIIISVDLNSDLEIVKNTLLKAIELHPAILKNPAPIIRFEKITPIGFDFMVRGFIHSDRASDQWDISSQVRINIIKKLKQENIKLSINKLNIDSENIDLNKLIK